MKLSFIMPPSQIYLYKASHYINDCQAEMIMSKLSDADRIQLQSQLDEVCDKQNHVADTVQETFTDLLSDM